MELPDFKIVAEQLRKPSGEFGLVIGENMNVSNAYMNKLAIDSLSISENDCVLELGMGNGKFVSDILNKHESVKYIGRDFSDVMVAEAKKINAGWVKGGRAKFYEGVADTLSWDTKTFSKILTVNTIYFWQKPEIELREIKRVLTDDGLFVIGIRPKDTMLKLPFTQYGFKLYSEEELKNLLTKNGFSIVSTHLEQEPPFEVNGQEVKLISLISVCSKQH
ncbi:MAG TPA: class I SAM-dependent methyltransferase [Bacteroidia bacterium]|nr:class I SAM-dependent methyltransferase [Bacteroidia bacterium]HNU33406.1 class I SAM-dependent methyltransferase [Bacteroidia bacterium]